MNDVVVNDGEQLCPQCNGRRVVLAYNSMQKKSVDVLCGACLGKGKLDWLEMVTGVKNDHLNAYQSPSCSSSSISCSSSQSETSPIEVVATIHSLRGMK